MYQHKNTVSAASTNAGDSAPAGASGVREHLRGRSYAEQTAMLAPGGDVQMKADGGGGGDKKKAKVDLKEGGEGPGAGLPDPIAALELKRVTVVIENGAWDKLSPEEQGNVLHYLQVQEEKARKSRRTKGYTVTLGTKPLEDQSDEALAAATADATYGSNRLADGRQAMGARMVTDARGSSQREIVNPESYIGINASDPDVERHVEEVDKPEAASYDAESTFPSARYKPEDMNNEAFAKTLESAAAYMAELRQRYGPDVELTLTVESGESLVTPPKGMVTGDLARLRAETAKGQARLFFESKGIDTTGIDFATESHIGTTPYVSGKDDPHDPRYTEEQFLRVRVEMKGDPPPKVTETHTTDAEVITLTSDSDIKHKIDWPEINLKRGNAGGGKSYGGGSAPVKCTF